ncbi:MAG: hypothetical protein COB01_01860 [Lutibacter sp.]|nr:MAG: hypothetical protein COB01_01860 [Lutibacter sp.]
MTKVLLIVITFFIVFNRDIYAQQITSTTEKAVKIGLLIRDNKSRSARNGAEMAIDKANKKEESGGFYFQLVIKSMEGPWGTGSKQAVDLIFNDNVWAIMGSHDGQNAHLVEQVITKMRTVFLSAWASDPTLSQAFVPWYFSCVPNNNQQATAFIEEIYTKRKISKIAIVSDIDYDSKKALESFVNKSKLEGKSEPLQFFYDNSTKNLNKLLTKIYEADVHGIMLFGQPSASLNFIQQLRHRKMEHPIFGSFSLLGERGLEAIELSNYNDVTLATSGNWLDELTFQKEYREKYGKTPNAVAAYAFDGMNLLIESIRNSGFDREKIQEAMSKIQYKGVTGSIQFDKKGNRLDAGGLIKINNGIPVTIEE